MISASQKNLVLIHGWGGAGLQGWFSQVAKYATDHDCEVIAPDFPHTDNPIYQEWVDLFEKEVLPHVHQDTIFVTHSLGPSFLMRYLSENTCSVGVVIFVAPVLQSRFTETDNFFESEFNFAKIQNSCQEIALICSNNDPYIPMEDFKVLAQNLSVDMILHKERGHYSQSENQNPEVIAELKKYY